MMMNDDGRLKTKHLLMAELVSKYSESSDCSLICKPVCNTSLPSTFIILLLRLTECCWQAWTTERRFCLSQIEQEVQEELDEEKRLSQLLNRKVTLEGLQMFVTVFRPKAEKAVQTYLPSLFSKLLKYFGGSRIPPVSSGDAKPGELLELQQSTAPVIRR